MSTLFRHFVQNTSTPTVQYTKTRNYLKSSFVVIVSHRMRSGRSGLVMVMVKFPIVIVKFVKLGQLISVTTGQDNC